jgi:hypothetical protein
MRRPAYQFHGEPEGPGSRSLAGREPPYLVSPEMPPTKNDASSQPAILWK